MTTQNDNLCWFSDMNDDGSITFHLPGGIQYTSKNIEHQNEFDRILNDVGNLTAYERSFLLQLIADFDP